MYTAAIAIASLRADAQSAFMQAVSDIETLQVDFTHGRTGAASDTESIAICEPLVLDLIRLPVANQPGAMERVLRGCAGAVVLVDSCRPADLPAARSLVGQIDAESPAPLAVAAYNQGLPGALPLRALRHWLRLSARTSLGPCILRERSSAWQVLRTLIAADSAGSHTRYTIGEAR